MSRFRHLVFGGLLSGLAASLAWADDVPTVHLVHPTPDGFTVFWENDGPADEPGIRVFADEAGSEEVTASLRRELLPQAVPFFRGSMDRAARAARTDFVAGVRDRGLAAVRVSGGEPDTRYYVQVESADGTFAPQDPPLPGIRTAWATGFVTESRQVIVRFSEDSYGAVALLEAEGAAAPLFAVVGDVAGQREARFNLDQLVDAGTGETLQPDDLLPLTVHFFPGESLHQTTGSSVDYTGVFRVAGAVSRDFVVDPDVDVAWFAFEPVADQMAGQPFEITVTARTAAGDLAESFSGSVMLEVENGAENPGATEAFEAGVLDGHLVTIGSTGDYRLTAQDPDSGAAGQSNAFVVTTDWENWLALHTEPDDLEDSLREQRRADPDGTGVPRLMQYAFDIDGAPSGSPVEEGIDEDDGERYLTVSFRRLQYAPDVRYLVMGSGSLDGWEVVDVIHPGSPEWVTARDNRAIGQDEARFLRVGIAAGDTFGFWQSGEYGIDALNDPAISAPDADPGDYGVTNLERYALGMSGPEPELERLPSRRTVTVDGEEYQEILFERLPAGEDVRYIVEVTSDFPNWQIIDEFGPGEPTEQVVRDTEPVPDEGYRIIRVRIESDE